MSCKNIQELTPFQIWHFSSTFWKGVSPCMFLVCIYKDQEYTRTHTFSQKVWVPVCLTLIMSNALLLTSHSFCFGKKTYGKMGQWLIRIIVLRMSSFFLEASLSPFHRWPSMRWGIVTGGVHEMYRYVFARPTQINLGNPSSSPLQSKLFQ